jgi:hypothetical protein
MATGNARLCFGLVALLGSVAVDAAVVNAVASNPNPAVGESFSVTVSGAGFPATMGATLGLKFNGVVVRLVGVEPAPGSPFTGGVRANLPFKSGDSISILGPLEGTPASGNFDAFVIKFKRIGPGAAEIVLTDDGQDFSWIDSDTIKPIPVTYHQVELGLGLPLGADEGATKPRDTVAELPGEKSPAVPAKVDTPSLNVYWIVLLGVAVVAIIIYVRKARS